MNTGIAEIIQNEANKLEKIKTDAAYLKHRKLEKIYRCYEIPASEKIIAYCKTHPLGITINGCVFTDVAFYPRPSFLSSAPSKGDLAPMRIEYRDFEKYLIIQAKERDSVFMQGTEQNYFICYPSLTAGNDTSSEIRKMLVAIQNHICETNPQSIIILNSIAETHLCKIRNEMKTNKLSDDLFDLLRGLIHTNLFRNQAFELLAECTYRLCDSEEYFTLINKYSNFIDKEKYEHYVKIPNEFKERFIADLSNPYLEFADEYINLIRYNITKSEKTQENQLYYILASVRAGNIVYARQLIKALIEKHGKEYALIAEDFACIYGNIKIQEVVKRLKDNQDIPEKLFNLTDALGFTPLHYALVLNCETAVRKLSGSKKFSNKTEYCQSDKVTDLLSYATAAYLQNADLLACVISNVSSEMMEISAQKRKLEKQIEKANSMIEKLERKAAKLGWEQNKEFIKDIFSGKFNIDDTAEDDEYYQNQQILSDSIQKLKNVIWDTNRELENLEEVERETYQCIVKQIAQNIKSFRCDKSPIVELFLSLYKNDASNIHFTLQSASENLTAISNDASEHILLKILDITERTSDFRVYDYEGFFFMLPDCIELNMPYRRIHIAEDGTIERFSCNNSSYMSKYPKYGDSWFSEEAHNNKQILKREYRELAKKYHPDVCADTHASRIFAAIQNEYEKLKK